MLLQDRRVDIDDCTEEEARCARWVRHYKTCMACGRPTRRTIVGEAWNRSGEWCGTSRSGRGKNI